MIIYIPLEIVVRELQAENVEAEEKADMKYKEVQIRYKEQRLERERQELLKKGSDELLKKGSDVQQLRQQLQKAKTTCYRSQWTVKLWGNDFDYNFYPGGVLDGSYRWV